MTGFRMDLSPLKRRLAKAGVSIRASAFRPDIEKFAASSLQTVVLTMPVRQVSKIVAAQTRQYDNRVNFIPSSHKLTDPALRVNDEGHWLHVGGKWYRPNVNRVPDEVWGVYQTLLHERNRRITRANQRKFIDERKQARFLYRKSWKQVADSARVRVSVSTDVRNAVTRRRKPVVQPLRGYARWQGGGDVLSLTMYNPFLEQRSRYKPFSGKTILAKAMARNLPQFRRDTENRVRRAIYAASKL